MFPSRTPAARPRFQPTLSPLEARDVPAVVVIDEYFRANQGDVLEVGFAQGLLANDFSDTNFGAILTATLTGAPAYGDFDADGDGTINVLANPVPANTVTINPDGSFRLVIPSNLPRNVQGLTFSYTVANALDPTEATGTGTVIVYLGRQATPRIAVGADAGSEPVVNVFDTQTGQLVHSILAYEPTFTGGVLVATADVNADGTEDIITIPGFGGAPRLRIFDGVTARPLFDTFVFESTFTGGGFVSVGDVNADSFPDVIVGAGIGGGPRVRVINGQTLIPFAPGGTDPFDPGVIAFDPVTGALQSFDVLMDFFAYEDSFRGGVRVAAGDTEGIGRDFIVTTPGLGGGPVVKAFDFNEVVGPPSVTPAGAPSNGLSTRQPINNYAINFNGSAAPSRSFLAAEDFTRTGLWVAAGDLTGDGRAEIVTGPLTGPAVIRVFDGQSTGLLNQLTVPVDTTSYQYQILNPNPLLPAGLVVSQTQPTGTLIPPSQAPAGLVGGADSFGPAKPFPGVAEGGIRVAVADWNNDGINEIITGAGPGNAARVHAYRLDGTDVASFLAFEPTLLNGIHVG